MRLSQEENRMNQVQLRNLAVAALAVAAIAAIGIAVSGSRATQARDAESLRAQKEAVAKAGLPKAGPPAAMGGMPDLEKELGLTPDQKAKMDKMRDGMMERMRSMQSGGQRPDMATMQQDMEAQRKEMEAILTPEQREKLSKLGPPPGMAGGMPGGMPSGMPGPMPGGGR
jgi:Spy/CpxP family protein refolding chaperone